MKDPFCDPETGECTPAELGNSDSGVKKNVNTEIIYIGDPMCSWCWGISPALKELRDHYKKEQVPFRIVVGGLRPGGGDEWNDQMKDFLAHHWQQVNERSGQPFGYALMDLDEFNYDTEPPCRAAVASRTLVGDAELEFFEEIQRKFYVESQDPGQVEFYRSICDDLNVDFDTFKRHFESEEIKKLTNDEFMLNRQWGVNGYPAVVLKKEDQLYMVARGFSTFEDMKRLSESIIKEESVE